MRKLRSIVTFALILFACQTSIATDKPVVHKAGARSIMLTVPDKSLSILIDYSKGCVIKQLDVKGKNILSSAGAYTGLSTGSASFTSADASAVNVTEQLNGITISGISYGDAVSVTETWHFKVTGNKITWRITRQYNNNAQLEDMAFPKWNFAHLAVWKGGILDNGGMVWCKYLKEVDDTYGVHTGGVTFWNPDSGNGLRISAATNNAIATKYSHSTNNEFTATQLVTDSALQQRYNLSRFVSKKANLFAPFGVKSGQVSVEYTLQYVDYLKEYSRGTLPGIDAAAVRELLNTTGRYGVVDNNIVGANGWLTNWKCLHEPFFAQIGMAVDDTNYTKNLSATLDREQSQAMLADGRVLSRWHDVPGDEIPGTYNAKTGYYEAMWGYTIDSQTGYVINASEQFDINGDLAWLKLHRESCEKALDWLIKRDANHNGIYEMLNNNIAEKRASDWLDIVWASYENAFVNAQLYEALNLWANCEKVLGNLQRAEHYKAVAARLKTAFNKPINEGGFWSPAKKQYVYWRDNDGSVHGDNLVTPVNFAAIAFGICDDKERIAQILGQIEERNNQEHLFHWPLCYDSFKQAEVSPGNWPFPKYENGDIFPTWGYMGIRAYVKYDKSIALKFINNILTQYKKDGLSSQRYSRVTQLGLGDDVLSGISTTITALYRDIYGIRPKWNRMGLEPNLSPALNGTQFTYTLRNTKYHLKLSVNNYSMATKGFSIKSKEAFGANKTGNELDLYPGNKEDMVLRVIAATPGNTAMVINNWTKQQFAWTMGSGSNYQFILSGLVPDANYKCLVNSIPQQIKADALGTLTIKTPCKPGAKFILEPPK